MDVCEDVKDSENEEEMWDVRVYDCIASRSKGYDIVASRGDLRGDIGLLRRKKGRGLEVYAPRHDVTEIEKKFEQKSCVA